MKSINYPLVATLVFGARLVALGASVGDSIALFAFCGLYAFSQYTDSRKVVGMNDQALADIENLKSSVNALKVAKTFQR